MSLNGKGTRHRGRSVSLRPDEQQPSAGSRQNRQLPFVIVRTSAEKYSIVGGMDMIRQLIAASGALIAVVASPLAPTALADDGQVVMVQSGKVRCAVSADNMDRGGGPMVVCELSNGQPWGMSPWETSKYNARLNLAIVRATGEHYWDRGSITGSDAAAAGGLSVNDGQTYNLHGWTIYSDGFRTRFTSDATRHGILVTEGYVRQF